MDSPPPTPLGPVISVTFSPVPPQIFAAAPTSYIHSLANLRTSPTAGPAVIQATHLVLQSSNTKNVIAYSYIGAHTKSKVRRVARVSPRITRAVLAAKESVLWRLPLMQPRIIRDENACAAFWQVFVVVRPKRPSEHREQPFVSTAVGGRLGGEPLCSRVCVAHTRVCHPSHHTFACPPLLTHIHTRRKPSQPNPPPPPPSLSTPRPRPPPPPKSAAA